MGASHFMRMGAVFISIVFCLGATCAEPALIARPDKKIHLLCLGDSHTENGVYAKTVFDALTKAGKATAKYRCLGFGGRTAGQLTAMLKENKLDFSLEADALNVACIMAGTNGYNVPDLKSLVDLVKQRGWYVVVLTAPPRRGPDVNSGAGGPGSNGGYNGEVRNAFPKLEAGKLQPVQVVDIVPPLLDPKQAGRGEWTDVKFNADGVHLNAEGYGLLGKTVADALLSVFAGK